MKTLIFYFSGTGNTRLVANEIKNNLIGETTLFEIKNDNKELPSFDEYDLIGIGYPIHGFNSPWFVYEFIKRFPKVNNKHFFTFQSSGEAHPDNNYSARKIIHHLRKKGYIPVQDFHYIMPYNMIFRHTSEMAKLFYVYVKALAKYNAIRLNEHDYDVVKYKWYKGWHTPIVRIEWPFAKLHGKLFKVDKKKCINCKTCVKTCPMNNIEYKDGKYVFHTKCALCMRCSFYCPKEAIKPGIFNGKWKITGSYNLTKIIDDPSVRLANENDKQYKKRILCYKKYFKNADALLSSKNIPLIYK